MVVIGGGDEDGGAAFKRVVNEFENGRRATYLRVIMANPLHEKMPALAIVLIATCNGFTAAHVRQQWQIVKQKWDTHLRDVMGPLVGHGSDGDARRFNLQLADMTSSAGKRYRVNWEGCRLSALTLEDGSVYGLHAQDSFHCSKKLQAPMNCPSRCLQIGKHQATWKHLRLVFDRFQPHEHGLRLRDVKRSDAMSVKIVQVTCTKKLRRCLRRLQTEPLEGQRPEDTLGTEIWLEVISLFLRVFFSENDSIATRARNASTVLNFLRLKLHWIDNSRDYNVSANCESKQCFQHACLQLESALLKIKYFGEFHRDVPLCLRKSGSDC